MASQFAWVDFADEDRRKMAEVLDLFKEHDTRDELGLGVVRDALADRLFPGTSTIQTRARYFLFVPWIYQRHERKKTAASDIAKKARKDELTLIEGLIAGGARDGVIGIEKREALQRLPSSIYWAGLRVWRIRQGAESQEHYHRTWERLLRSQSRADREEGEPLDGTAAMWDMDLPDAPADFPKASATLDLTREEAEYLHQRVIGLGETLLGHLVSRTKAERDCTQVWLHPEFDGFPKSVADDVSEARQFSEAMHGAALLYNLMLSQEGNDTERIGTYENEFSSWAGLMESRGAAFRAWNRESFWALIRQRTLVSLPSQRFIDAWLDLALGAKPAALVSDATALTLIREREQVLKRGRARLGNQRALERWSGSAGAQQLNYRWHRVRAIVADIIEGLER